MGKRKAEGADLSVGLKRLKPSAKLALLPCIGTYSVLPVPLTPDDTFARCLFFSEHKSKKDDSKGSGHTLFVTNLPVAPTEAMLERVFSSAGEVQGVNLASLKGSSSFAHISFKDASSLAAAKISLRRPRFNEHSDAELEASPPLGLEKWIQRCRAEQAAAPSAQFDQAMLDFEHREEEEILAIQAKASAAADDGWTLVTKKAKGEKASKAVGQAGKTGTKQLQNFYGAQIREGKRDQLALMRVQFEKDKARVAKLKASRRFNPF